MKQTSKFSFLFLLFVLIFSQTGKAQEVTGKNNILVMTGEFSDKGATGAFAKSKDAAVLQKRVVFIGSDEKVYKIITDGEKIIELYVDGQKVSAEQIPQYEPFIKNILDKMALVKKLEKLEDELSAEEDLINDEESALDEVFERLETALEKLNDLEENRNVNLSAERENLRQLREKNSKLRQSLLTKLSNLSSKRQSVFEQRHVLNYVSEINKVLLKVIDDLKAEGIVKGEQKVSFKLTNNEFIVNNQRQSPELHQKFKAKYIIGENEDSGFLYYWKNNI